MRRFTELYMELDATTRTSDKIAALVRYFDGADAADAAWAVALLLGERPRGSASSTVLRALALEVSGVPPWLFEECRAAVGDLSETVALVLPPPGPREATTAIPESLATVIEERVVPLAGADDATRARIIADAWSVFDRHERFVYHKLLRGGFRVGVQRGNLARALAQVADVEPAVMQHRLSGTFAPTAEAYTALLEAGDDAGPRPYPFYLARPLAGDVEDLGDRADWDAEWKYDGIRAQLIRRDDDVFLWSRGQELITHQFPEIATAARALAPDTAIDGEVLLWREGRPAPFAALQKRLNRKVPPKPQLGLFEREHVVFVAFDILEHDGRDVRGQDQRERAALLAHVLRVADSTTLVRSEPIATGTWAELAALRETSRERGVEGLMLKHAASPYMSGRVTADRGGGWFKWKVDPYTVDAVMVYAYPGSGRRATLFTDYGFAVWADDDTGGRTLVPFTRAYSGLDQKEIEALDAWIRRNAIRRMGPAREVRPERVFEIGFEGIARSSRHRAGVAVRFPRILRERTDKRPEDADTLAALLALLDEP